MKTETGPDPSYCSQCGTPLKAESKFCPKCGTEVTKILSPAAGFEPQTVPQAPTSSSQTQPKQMVKRTDNRILLIAVIAIIIVILVLPIFPVSKTVMVSGTMQTVTNTTSFSTSLEVVTQSTQSQISVYTGSFQYMANNYYYSYSPWWNQGCYWYHKHIVCNYNQWYWYQPSYGTTVTVSPSDNVVNVIRTQQGYSESLILVYYNGQQSQTYNNVYVDNLAANGVSTIPGTSVVTNTIVNTVVNPMTQTVPCNQCVPMTVTEHVSILQYLLGYY